MINRKTKQIREANLILEKRYLNEQVAATPPSATTSPVVTTTTTVTKMSETELENLPVCSGFKTEGYTKTEEGNYYIFTSPTPPKEGVKPSRCKKSKNPN